MAKLEHTGEPLHDQVLPVVCLAFEGMVNVSESDAEANHRVQRV